MIITLSIVFLLILNTFVYYLRTLKINHNDCFNFLILLTKKKKKMSE